MIRAGWAVFRRDLRSVVPARRIRTAVLAGSIATVVVAGLLLVGGFVWGWYDVGPVRIVLGSVSAALAAGCFVALVCPLGPLPTGERMLRDTAEYAPPTRLVPYFARRRPQPIPPEDREAVLYSAGRQRNWLIPRTIRWFTFGTALVLAILGSALLVGLGRHDVFRLFLVIYGPLMWANGVDTLRRLGYVERTRLAALAVPEPPPADDTARRRHPRGSVLGLPEE